jgi:oligopeptide/dipeptide ABC transporter ATP-binding protein
LSQVLNTQSEPLKISSPLLEVSNLSVTYKREIGAFSRRTIYVDAVVKSSFAIGESDSVALIGETGSGKSTIAKCIVNLVKPTEGTIKFHGKDITRLKGKELRDYRKSVQMIFQDPYESLNPVQDVFSALSNPLRRLLGIKDPAEQLQRVQEILTEVGLDPARVIRRYPHQLSGGERQRVNIARAIAPSPELIIADEPITMLDAEQRLNIMRLLSDLQKKRKLAILLITHELASAKFLSSKMIVIYSGRLVESGEAAQVTAKPHHPYVELIMQSTPRINEAPISSGKISTAPVEDLQIGKGCVFRPRCPYATSVCAEREPNLEIKSEGHFAACFNSLNMT